MGLIILNIFLLILGCAFIFATLLGLAGNTMLLVLTFLYAFITDFRYIDGSLLGWIFAIYALGELWGFVASYLGIKKEKVSYFKVALIGAGTFFGGLFGSFISPIFGSFLGAAFGAFVVAFLVEILTNQDRHRALYIACVAAAMQLICIFGKMFFALLMLIIFLWNIPW